MRVCSPRPSWPWTASNSSRTPNISACTAEIWSASWALMPVMARETPSAVFAIPSWISSCSPTASPEATRSSSSLCRCSNNSASQRSSRWISSSSVWPATVSATCCLTNPSSIEYTRLVTRLSIFRTRLSSQCGSPGPVPTPPEPVRAALLVSQLLDILSRAEPKRASMGGAAVSLTLVAVRATARLQQLRRWRLPLLRGSPKRGDGGQLRGGPGVSWGAVGLVGGVLLTHRARGGGECSCGHVGVGRRGAWGVGRRRGGCRAITVVAITSR